eukprot:15457086-Alexandrium_andersonii.AAC.1
MQAKSAQDTLPQEIQQFEDALKNGFQSRSPVATKFYRDGEGGKSSEYGSLNSNAQRREFREQWAKARLRHLQTCKYKRTSLSIQEIEEGVFLPYAKVVEMEGGKDDEQARVAAYNHCKKCVEMGEAFTAYNAFSK